MSNDIKDKALQQCGAFFIGELRQQEVNFLEIGKPNLSLPLISQNYINFVLFWCSFQLYSH
jgi:hypothetical protein